MSYFERGYRDALAKLGTTGTQKTAFQLAIASLDKTAMRREIKELRAGNLSPEDIARLVENNREMLHEREIKPLGTGGTMQADLVMHPEHGVVVRKRVSYPTDVEKLPTHPNIQIYEAIKEYQDKKGPSGFARVREVDPNTGLVFQDQAVGDSLFAERNKARTVSFLSDEKTRLAQKLRELPEGVPEIDDVLPRYERTRDLLDKIRERGQRPVPVRTFSPEQLALIEHLKRNKAFPHVYDYDSPWNIIKGPTGKKTIIDVSGGVMAPMHYLYGERTPYEQFKKRVETEFAAPPTQSPKVPPSLKRNWKPWAVMGGTTLGALAVAALINKYSKSKENPR